MKLRHTAAFCLFTFLAAVTPPAHAQPAAAGAANLLRNPGLETTVPGNSPLRYWDTFTSDLRPGAAALSLTGDAVYEGRRALLIDIKNPQAAGIFQTVDVRPDTFYRFSVRVKTESLVSSGPGVHLLVADLNAAASGFSGTSNGWGELQLYFKTASDQTKASVAVLVGARDQPVRGRVWLDDASLVKIDGPPPAAAPRPASPVDAVYPWSGAGLAVFIALACLLLAAFVFLTVRKKQALAPTRRWPDLVLAGGLTLICAFIAFYHLGTFDSPQTYYQAHREGESFTLDLGAALPVSRVMYFTSLGNGSYRLDFSDDLSSWRDPKTLEQKKLQMDWRVENTGFQTRYLRVTAVKPGLMLGEIAVFSDADGSLLPIKAVLPGTGASAPAEDPRLVGDEPERVPPMPSYLNGTYFDECYFARSAYNYTLGLDSYEESHPPLGKLTIALGIELFGFTPFGWRFMGTVFGILMIPIMYALGLTLFKKREWAFVGAFLFAFDFMRFTQTRIATIDVFGVFWIMLMYWFMYRALREDPFTRRPGKLLLNLFLSGLCFGIGAASKWIVIYGAVGLAAALIARYVSAAVWYFRGFFQARQAAAVEKNAVGESDGPAASPAGLGDHTRPFLKRTGLIFVFSMLVFVILPAGVYLASYIPFMTVRGPADPHTSPLTMVLDEQKLMFGFHSSQNEMVDGASPWYEWPLDYRPMWFFTGNQYLFRDTASDIFSFGNPAVWWVGSMAAIVLLAIAVMAWIKTRLKPPAASGGGDPQSAGAVKRYAEKYAPGLFILVALAAQFLPWIVIPRQQTFIYHFFASVPHLILAIVFVFKTMVEKKPGLRWGVFVYLGIVMLLFFLFYPLLSGARADTAFVNGVLKWFPSWFQYL